MEALLSGLGILIEALRKGFSLVVVVAAALATVAWAVRTRRVGPFSALARFTRSTIDPLITPVERRILRAGGSSASAPWWALLFLFLIGVAVVFILIFVRDALRGAYTAVQHGPSGLAVLAITWTFGLLQLALLVRVITSWIGGTYSAVGRLSASMTEWFLAPLRRVLPPLGMIDVSPLVAWFLLGLIQRVILSVL